MKKTLLSLFFFGVALSAAPVNVTFVNAGSPLLASGGMYVGPYTLNVNGQNLPAMCMDDFLHVSNGDKWTANVTGATAYNLSNTYLGNNGVKTLFGTSYSSNQVYRAEAYLFSLLLKPAADRANIQDAAWTLMDPNNQFSGNKTVQGYMHDALNSLSTFNASNYSIISQTGTYSSNSKQEFMVVSPEPSTFALLGAAMVGLGTLRFRRRRKQ